MRKHSRPWRSVDVAVRRAFGLASCVPELRSNIFLLRNMLSGTLSGPFVHGLVCTVITQLFACYLYFPLQREPSLRLPTALSVSRLLRWPCRVTVPTAVAAVGGACLGVRGGWQTWQEWRWSHSWSTSAGGQTPDPGFGQSTANPKAQPWLRQDATVQVLIYLHRCVDMHQAVDLYLYSPPHA